jgi:hypothetical protein
MVRKAFVAFSFTVLFCTGNQSKETRQGERNG